MRAEASLDCISVRNKTPLESVIRQKSPAAKIRGGAFLWVNHRVDSHANHSHGIGRLSEIHRERPNKVQHISPALQSESALHVAGPPPPPRHSSAQRLPSNPGQHRSAPAQSLSSWQEPPSPGVPPESSQKVEQILGSCPPNSQHPSPSAHSSEVSQVPPPIWQDSAA